MGTRCGYQHGPQRRAWNTKAAAEPTKKPVCKHRSVSTPPLQETCAARHCQGPVIHGQIPQEKTLCTSVCCNITLVSATASSPSILYPSLPPPSLSHSPLISRYFNPVLSGWGIDVLRRPTWRDRAKSKAEPQELCEQRIEREISPSSLRNSGLNLHNQQDVPCICGIPD